MKRILSFTLSLFLVLSLLMYPNMRADASNVSLSVSASTVSIGDTVKVTVAVPEGISATVDLIFSSDILSFVSSSVEVGNNGGTITINAGKMTPANANSVTITFKANTSGDANLSANVISAVDDNTVEDIALGGASTKITVSNQASTPEGDADSQKSGDNSLSSLKLSAGSLSPSFKPNTTKYTASVNYSVTSVVVSAKTSNAKAVIESVTGDGTVNLSVGQNTIEVVVRAENGVKAKYTIIVTRKTEAESEPQASETETEEGEVNEVLQWNGEQLKATKEIPKESIPADFEETSLVVNGQQMPGLSFEKGYLKVLYLNNSNDAGSFYVYDEELQTIYPFIKIESEKSYVIVLLPNEQKIPAPEGFESCTFSIEGKGLVTAYQLKGEGAETIQDGTESVEDSTSVWNIFGADTFYAAEPNASEFYLMYCMNDKGEQGWYMYDSVEETFQRYVVVAPSVQTEAELDLESQNAALQKELNTAKMTQYIIIGVAAVVIILLIGAIVIIIIKNRSNDDFFDEYDDEDDYDDYHPVEEQEEDVVAKAVEKIVETESKNAAVPVVDDGDLEFIDFD